MRYRRPARPIEGTPAFGTYAMFSADETIFAGHPFSTIGTAAHMRSHLRAAGRALLQPQVLDIYKYAERSDPDCRELVLGRETQGLPRGSIRVFYINGDEASGALKRLNDLGEPVSDGFNIVVPFWELPHYPREWAEQLNRFDAVWASSEFIRESLRTAGIEAPVVGGSVEIAAKPFLSRRRFQIRESAFAFLTFFDTTSFATRKNPQAVLDMFAQLKKRKPLDDLQLILKVKSGDANAAELARRFEGEGVMVISEPLTNFETESLVAAVDCFVSLHRSEGFCRGAGEAMSLGRLAMGTGWSVNVDFMSSGNSLLVNYALVPVGEDQYPHWRGQHWAEPDIDHAVHLAIRAIDDASWRESLTQQARMDIISSHGDTAIGLKILRELEAVASRSSARGTCSP